MKKAFVISSLLVVLTLSLGGSVASKGADSSATYEQLRLFTEVLSHRPEPVRRRSPAEGPRLQRDQGNSARPFRASVQRPAQLVPRPG